MRAREVLRGLRRDLGSCGGIMWAGDGSGVMGKDQEG